MECIYPGDSAIISLPNWAKVNISTFFFWLHHAACGILAPQTGTEPVPPPWKRGVLTTGLHEGSQYFYFKMLMNHRFGTAELVSHSTLVFALAVEITFITIPL